MAKAKKVEKEKHEEKPKKAKPIPKFVRYSKEEVEKLIVKLAKEGKTQSEIGLILRDTYGVPSVKLFGLKIGKVLEKHGLAKEIPEDLFNLLKKAVRMHEHLKRHKKDKYCVHRFQLIEDRIRALVKYYKRVGKLPSDWEYSIERAKLIVK